MREFDDPPELPIELVESLVHFELASELSTLAVQLAAAVVDYTTDDLRGHGGSAGLGRSVLRELVELVILLDVPLPPLPELIDEPTVEVRP